jgi:hypothetical protein
MTVLDYVAVNDRLVECGKLEKSMKGNGRYRHFFFSSSSSSSSDDDDDDYYYS